jgi:hypothetical protein
MVVSNAPDYLRRLSLLGWLGLLASGAWAQASPLTRLIRENHLPLTPGTGQAFSGAGWDRLHQDVSRSQFVLVGEMHGTAQIPQFTAALAQVLQPTFFVAEISRYEAEDLSQLVAQPGPPHAYLAQHPFALSFYSWPAEFALARQLRAQQVQLLGIDQLSCFAAGRFLSRLAERARRPAAKAYLQRQATACQAADRAIMATDASQLAMFQPPAATLDSLRALTRGESAPVRQLVADFAASCAIYHAQVTHTGGHQERVGLMKSNLLRELRTQGLPAGEPLPKMLFKFGDEHMARGLSYSNLFDVGNLVINLADMQNQASLHLLVMGKRGAFSGGFNPDEPSKNVVTYSPTELAWLQPFYDQVGESWGVFDLRPARQALLKGQLHIADQPLERAILGYDYLIIIPETTANPAW